MSETDSMKKDESKFPGVQLVRSKWSCSGRGSREAAQSPGGHSIFMDLHSRDNISSPGPGKEKTAFPLQRALRDSPTRHLLSLRRLWLAARHRPLWRSHRRQGSTPTPSSGAPSSALPRWFQWRPRRKGEMEVPSFGVQETQASSSQTDSSSNVLPEGRCYSDTGRRQDRRKLTASHAG